MRILAGVIVRRLEPVVRFGDVEQEISIPEAPRLLGRLVNAKTLEPFIDWLSELPGSGLFWSTQKVRNIFGGPGTTRTAHLQCHLHVGGRFSLPVPRDRLVT